MFAVAYFSSVLAASGYHFVRAMNTDNGHEKFIELLARHEGVIRASIRAVVRRPEDVDEIMQAVSITAWRRFDSVTDVEGFAKWA